MVWQPNGEKMLKICLFVSTELTNVAHTHTHSLCLHIIAQQKHNYYILNISILLFTLNNNKKTKINFQ